MSVEVIEVGSRHNTSTNNCETIIKLRLRFMPGTWRFKRATFECSVLSPDRSARVIDIEPTSAELSLRPGQDRDVKWEKQGTLRANVEVMDVALDLGESVNTRSGVASGKSAVTGIYATDKCIWNFEEGAHTKGGIPSDLEVSMTITVEDDFELKCWMRGRLTMNDHMDLEESWSFHKDKTSGSGGIDIYVLTQKSELGRRK